MPVKGGDLISNSISTQKYIVSKCFILQNHFENHLFSQFLDLLKIHFLILSS